MIPSGDVEYAGKSRHLSGALRDPDECTYYGIPGPVRSDREELARQGGVQWETIVHPENGVYTASPRLAGVIAKTLNAPTEVLFIVSGEPEVQE
jgi:DNA-binding XRE family transcriptional regulator